MTNKRVLLIGYGNTLRSDDGVGYMVACQLQSQNIPGLETIATLSLTPELSEKMAEYQTVIFVDACVSQDTLTLTRIETPHQPPDNWPHKLTPASLLKLTQWIYHKTPDTWIIAIPAKNLDFGQNISQCTKKQAQLAIELVKNFISRQ
ncbi:MAG: hydrogenase maturation protease [Geminocystis sp.]|nr:hydrogenase maturation protease [Geminocystis sp.]HIK37105.1 hydrogenase maturation protease [Geminocystis sp. M7585_C2015_104]MCS7147036.1 hydrogenase maturation protease [Geminocystis sp.]MCX8079312.1 hydrogenase maturation protease [Geminocystis sp.]MDW8115859.1 hydrogenase maturation protease [Geminocystis sp.]